jgi:protein-S-isoprenylcysteine O-methyltransferase Ste14
MLLIQSFILVLATGILAYFSRRALKQPRSHGFYRFFAWEAILILFILNVPGWFHNPQSWHQIISWFLLVISLIPLLLGVQSLKKAGRPISEIPSIQSDDETLFEFEKTTSLETSGIYKYIRHPLYCSLLLLAWGIFFKQPAWVSLLLALAASLFLTLTAAVEEQENIRFFGPPYQEYMRGTHRFIPFVF